MPLDCEESVGHSCGCPFGLSSETGLLVTTSFSGSDRMDNVLKDHRCPSIRAKALSRTKISWPCRSTASFAREVEDQDSGNLTLNHPAVDPSFHQPSIRPKHRP